jgi:hypothetical protein
VLVAAVLFEGTGLAQDAPPAAEPALPPAPAPAAEPKPAPAPAALAPAPEPVPAEQPADQESFEIEPMSMEAPSNIPIEGEEESGVPGWFRIDADRLGIQLWVGATHNLFGLDLASDILVRDTLAQLDLGILVQIGPVALLPEFGMSVDFGNQELASLVPQLFTIIDASAIYFESWIQGYLNSATEYRGGANSLYTRDFILLKVSDDFRIGPQCELTIALNDGAKGLDGDAITSLQVGGRVNVAYGEKNTLGLFVGTETDDDSRLGNDDIVGRFTFVRTW